MATPHYADPKLSARLKDVTTSEERSLELRVTVVLEDEEQAKYNAEPFATLVVKSERSRKLAYALVSDHPSEVASSPHEYSASGTPRLHISEHRALPSMTRAQWERLKAAGDLAFAAWEEMRSQARETLGLPVEGERLELSGGAVFHPSMSAGAAYSARRRLHVPEWYRLLKGEIVSNPTCAVCGFSPNTPYPPHPALPSKPKLDEALPLSQAAALQAQLLCFICDGDMPAEVIHDLANRRLVRLENGPFVDTIKATITTDAILMLGFPATSPTT